MLCLFLSLTQTQNKSNRTKGKPFLFLKSAVFSKKALFLTWTSHMSSLVKDLFLLRYKT